MLEYNLIVLEQVRGGMDWVLGKDQLRKNAMYMELS